MGILRKIILCALTSLAIHKIANTQSTSKLQKIQLENAQLLDELRSHSNSKLHQNKIALKLKIAKLPIDNDTTLKKGSYQHQLALAIARNKHLKELLFLEQRQSSSKTHKDLKREYLNLQRPQDLRNQDLES